MKNNKQYSKAALIAMLGLLLLIWYSCNPYRQLGKRPPLTTKDSAALLSRCVTVTPLDTATNSQPPYVAPEHPDSTEYYKAQADSLAQVKRSYRDSILLRYKDTCRSVIKLLDNEFGAGFKAGEVFGKQNSAFYYKMALKEADSICNAKGQAAILDLKKAYNLRLASAQTNERVAEANAEKYRGKMDFWKTWALIATSLAALFLILCILFWKFKRQAKAANSIINSGEDIAAKIKNLK